MTADSATEDNSDQREGWAAGEGVLGRQVKGIKRDRLTVMASISPRCGGQPGSTAGSGGVAVRCQVGTGLLPVTGSQGV